MTTTSQIYQCTLDCQAHQKEASENTLIADPGPYCSEAGASAGLDYCKSLVDSTILVNCERPCVEGFVQYKTSPQNCITECNVQKITSDTCDTRGSAIMALAIQNDPNLGPVCANINKFNANLAEMCSSECGKTFANEWWYNETRPTEPTGLSNDAEVQQP